jgi:hypothetical protein
MMSYWKRIDERLIKRGMLIMDLNFLRNYRDELIRYLFSLGQDDKILRVQNLEQNGWIW